MNSPIYNPLEEYEGKIKDVHSEKTKAFFENLVNISKVNAEENRITVAKYNEYKENMLKLKKKLNLWRFLRVLMCISLILIPLVIIKITPKIRAMREEISKADKKAE